MTPIFFFSPGRFFLRANQLERQTHTGPAGSGQGMLTLDNSPALRLQLCPQLCPPCPAAEPGLRQALGWGTSPGSACACMKHRIHIKKKKTNQKTNKRKQSQRLHLAWVYCGCGRRKEIRKQSSQTPNLQVSESPSAILLF